MRILGYVRYMDDFVLFDDRKSSLLDALPEVESFLEERLGLELKAEATILAPHHQGLPFLGWRLYRGAVRLRPKNLRRTRRRLKLRLWEWRAGLRSEESLADCVRSMAAHLKAADLTGAGTLGLRRSLFERRVGQPGWNEYA